MRKVKSVLERYHAGEFSVFDVARALKISLRHAERIVNESRGTPSSSTTNSKKSLHQRK
jgi:hypothetical protein